MELLAHFGNADVTRDYQTIDSILPSCNGHDIIKRITSNTTRTGVSSFSAVNVKEIDNLSENLDTTRTSRTPAF